MPFVSQGVIFALHSPSHPPSANISGSGTPNEFLPGTVDAVRRQARPRQECANDAATPERRLGTKATADVENIVWITLIRSLLVRVNVAPECIEFQFFNFSFGSWHKPDATLELLRTPTWPMRRHIAACSRAAVRSCTKSLASAFGCPKGRPPFASTADQRLMYRGFQRSWRRRP